MYIVYHTPRAMSSLFSTFFNSLCSLHLGRNRGPILRVPAPGASVKCFLGILYQNILNPRIKAVSVKVRICLTTNPNNLIHDFDGLVFGCVNRDDDVGSHCCQRLEV